MRIGILFLDNMLATSAFNALELWQAARDASLARVRSKPPLTASAQPKSTKMGSMHVSTIAVHDLSVHLSSGMSLQAQCLIDETPYDLLYVPALWRNPRISVAKNPELVVWLQRQYEAGAIINATGTGVCFVAATGLLNGAAATTHWHYFDQFARDYPLIQLKRQYFITESARIYCAGSINALTDLTIHHVHRFLGRTVADHLSRHFSAEVRQPFDRLRFDQSKSDLHPDEDVLQVQLWLEHNLSRTTVNLQEVAKQFGFSQRSLNRRFKEATGITPSEYLQRLRFDEACELLKKSNLSIADVAARVGIVDASYFAKLFKQRTALSPTAYRTTTRAKLFNLKPSYEAS